MNYNINSPVCGSNIFEEIIKLEKYPLSNVKLSFSKEEALKSETFDMNICICRDCSHIYNRTPVKIEYKQGNKTYFTNELQKAYIKKLVNDLVKKYNIQEMNILEIGVGDGYFLRCLANYNNICIGYEPSLDKVVKEDKIIIINDYFDPSLHLNIKYNFIVIRHVLEHFDNPYKFLKTIVESLINQNQNSKFFIEVPNIEPTLKNLRINDFIHEHISHFSKYSLKYLLQRINLDIIEIYTTQNNENIVAICKINDNYLESINNIYKYKINFNTIINKLKNDFKIIREKSKTIAIWGAEGRGASFIKNIKDFFKGDEFIIDSDKRKFGKFIPAIGLQISSYEDLIDKDIDTIIITTAIGKNNILKEIKEHNIKVKNIYCITENGLTKV